MTEIELIKKEIKSVEDKYLNNFIEVMSDYERENQTRDDYNGRQLYELLQNADDCYTNDCNEIDVKINLIGNRLIVQNTGKPFNARGIVSLMHTNASPKYSNTIGCKGLGFRSVLNWAYDITICTNNFCVNFSEKKAKEKINYYKNNSEMRYEEDKKKIDSMDRMAILCCPIVVNKPKISKFLDDGYSTSIVLLCRENYVADVEKQLKEFQFEELLFLKHIRSITIDSDLVKRSIKVTKENNIFKIQDGDQYTEWEIHKKEGAILVTEGIKKPETTEKQEEDNDAQAKVEKEKNYEFIIAYNKDSTIREDNRKNGVLYSFFKTQIPMPFPFLIHGTFDLKSDRNNLVDNKNNKKLLEILIEFIIDTGLSIAEERIHNNECDYDLLKFLIPSQYIDLKIKDYDFSKSLKEKIIKYNIFPTICNKYISINDNPKYSDSDFCKVLKHETFSNLLKKCDDTKIRDFIRSNNIYFYKFEEITSLINKDADYYVDNKLNARIIELYYDTYYINWSCPKIAPKILTDSKGKRIDDDGIRVFNNPKNKIELPGWSELRFINRDLEAELCKYWNCSAADLIKKFKNLGIFYCDEYEFNNILNALTEQCNDDKKKVIDLLKWLFDNWKIGEEINNDTKLISRDGLLINSSICFFGKEYDNLVGERIISCTSSPTFIAKPNDLGLGKEPIEQVKMFLKSLGVKVFPKIKFEQLNDDDTSEYLRYNRNLTPFSFSRSSKDIVKVDTIKELEQILINADFNDVLYWILNDNDLYSHIENIHEINYSSYMEVIPSGKRKTQPVSHNDMYSWIRKIFTETKWLPTSSGKKANVYNCTLVQHELSPVVESIKIDYDALKSLFKRNCKKEIDVLLEKIGVAENIVNLSKEKIYEILLNLPTLDRSKLFGKKIYNQLNFYFKDEKLDELLRDNEKYEQFKKEGYVLAKVKRGEFSYLPVSEVYYAGKKIYCNAILNKIPKLELNRRAGDSKVERMFCVEPISEKIKNPEITNIEYHNLNDEYWKEYKKTLPYIYAKRIDSDNRNRDLNELKKWKVCLILNATIIYHIDNETKTENLNDYEVLYVKDKNIAYIKVPHDIEEIDELKQTTAFISSVSEIITAILDVDGDKDAFTYILSLKTQKDLEYYFEDNGDDTLSNVNRAKEKIGDEIDFEKEFWNALSKIGDINSELKTNTTINFNDINSSDNALKIIELFRKLNIDVDDYNIYAYEKIELTNFFKNELKKLKTKYRSKYLLHLARELLKSGGTDSEFYINKNNYDFIEDEIDFKNSIKTNVIDLLEQKLCVQLRDLDNLEGDYNVEVKKLNKKEKIKTPSPIDEPSENIDYIKLDSEIRDATTSDKTKKIKDIVNDVENYPKESKKNSRVKHTPKTISSKSQHTKDYDGFAAEDKVYRTLQNRLKNHGTVVWVSGNGQKISDNAVSADDTLGYDIKYIDDKGNKHYVEVKGTSSNVIEFTLTYNEYKFAEKNKDLYELWFVFIDKSGKPNDPIELGNIMKFKEGENFFNNNTFSVRQGDFKIKWKKSN